MANHIENYLKDYGDDVVSEKSLKYLLPLLYPDVIKEVSVKKIASFYDNIRLFDETIKNKRFDFISVSKRLIIEFDGPQHFEHIEHFGSFEQFIERQCIDLDKQRFVKENDFHLIRITGKLTLREFYDLVKDKKFNNDHGQVIFIENTNIYEANISQLKEMSDETVILKLKVKNLQNELNLLKSQSDNNKLNQIKKKIPKDLVHGTNQVYQFLLWVEERGLLVGQPPTNGLYPMYVNWNREENPGSKPLKAKEFTARLKIHLAEFGLEYINDKISVSKISKLNFNVEVLNKYFFNYKININKYSSSRYIICKDQITDDYVAEIKEKLQQGKLNFDDLSYKELLTIYYLADLMDEDAISFIKILEELNGIEN